MEVIVLLTTNLTSRGKGMFCQSNLTECAQSQYQIMLCMHSLQFLMLRILLQTPSYILHLVKTGKQIFTVLILLYCECIMIMTFSLLVLGMDHYGPLAWKDIQENVLPTKTTKQVLKIALILVHVCCDVETKEHSHTLEGIKPKFRQCSQLQYVFLSFSCESKTSVQIAQEIM